MLLKGTETFAVDTKQLISGWDSPPTQISMICHWMLSAPMSCYSPPRSSLQLSCLGHLWCTGSESGAFPFIMTFHLPPPHTPDITAFQKEAWKE